MLKPIKFASVAAAVSVVWQIVYTMKVAVVPDIVHYWMNVMMPGYNLAAIETSQVNWGEALLGALVAGIVVWVTVFVVIWLYNYWAE